MLGLDRAGQGELEVLKDHLDMRHAPLSTPSIQRIFGAHMGKGPQE